MSNADPNGKKQSTLNTDNFDLSIILPLLGGGKKKPLQNNNAQNNNAQNNDAQNNDAQNNDAQKSQNKLSVIDKDFIESFDWIDKNQNINLIINYPCKLE